MLFQVYSLLYSSIIAIISVFFHENCIFLLLLILSELCSRNIACILNETLEFRNLYDDQIGYDCMEGMLVPSPFKKALFWPNETVPKQRSKKKKEKIPSVTMSDAWKEYYLKKEEEKRRRKRGQKTKKRRKEKYS